MKKLFNLALLLLPSMLVQNLHAQSSALNERGKIMKHIKNIIIALISIICPLHLQSAFPDSRGKILSNDDTHLTLSPIGGYLQKSADVVESVGKKGLECYYDERLVSGTDLPTVIDAKLQKETENILDSVKLELNAIEILAMVMDSKTGELLTIASSNRYDPIHIKPIDIPSLNPKFSEYPYEPGSVIKPITASLALDKGVVTLDDTFDLYGGKLQIGEKRYITDDFIGDNSANLEEIIVHSSNIGISQVSWKLSGKEFRDGLMTFGFGHKSGIDLSRDLEGKLRSEDKLEHKLHRANTSYGYGLMVTPLQILKAYSVFSNKGEMVTPHIATVETYTPIRVLSPKTVTQMKSILQSVVEKGTGQNAKVDGLVIGGKTGTAHIAKNGKYTNHYNSSFFGFAEDEKGKSYTIGVLVIDAKGKNKYFASNSAVPTFKKIVDEMVKNELLTPLVKNDDMSIVSKSQKQLELLRQRLNITQNKANVSSYKGDKTISPLIGGKAIKHFGMYIDPVYDIKIFNESVTLKSEKSNAKVYCVSDGKVVFVGKSMMLGKVVVMAHENSLHTVYAGLSEIAPTVRVGKKLGAAYILGRVKEKLIFQVTEDGNFVDPMEVIGNRKNGP